MDLNESQKRAVMHKDGPMLVLAGPGSGKTRVITERVAQLIESGVAPEHILTITFTKAAATEMKNRYRDSGAKGAGKVRFGTFHSIFFMILKVAYNYNAGNILREDVHYSILKNIVAGVNMEIQDENEFVNDIASEISRVKGNQIDIESYYSPTCPADIFKEIYIKYNSELSKRRLVDFDDMLVYCYELLEQRKDIRKMWQKQFRYILIDEFQDVNYLQYITVKLLAQPNNNLFIVGDDDQSIYGFRGARPDIMKQFVNDYKDAEQVRLDINYRSSNHIVRAAGRVISHNKQRMGKNIRSVYAIKKGKCDNKSAKTNAEKDEPVDIREFNNISEENEKIRQMIGEYHDNGFKYSDIAILYRTNTQSRSLVSKLKSYNIPFFMKDMIPNIYEHWIAQDVLSYIKIALGDNSRGLYLRIINRPKRYIGRNAFTEPEVSLDELEKFYEDKSWMIERIEQLGYDLKMIASMKPFAAVNFIRRGIGYDDYIREYAEYRNIKPDDMFELLDELTQEAKDKNSFEEWFEYIKDYAKELAEQKEKQKQQRIKGENEDAVVIQTMHSSKGLEYNCVFIPEANEGVTPHSKAVLDADMEEERRMFYVAMTRAKKFLHIFFLKERYNKEADMSRFVEEIISKDEENKIANN